MRKCKRCGSKYNYETKVCHKCRAEINEKMMKRFEVESRKCLLCGIDIKVLCHSTAKLCVDCRAEKRKLGNKEKDLVFESCTICGSKTCHSTGVCYKCRDKMFGEIYTPVINPVVNLKELGFKPDGELHFKFTPGLS